MILRRFGDFALGFFAYYLGTQMGLAFSLPPGYLSLLWPACGLSLAVILLRGPLAAIGVAIGILFINFSFVYSSFYSIKLVTASILVGTSLTTLLQIMLSKWAINTWLQTKQINQLTKPFFSLLILVSLFTCIISASGHVASMWLRNIISNNELTSAFQVVWIGDYLGLVLFTPVALATYNLVRQKNTLQAAVIIVGASLFVLTLYFTTSKVKHAHSEQLQEAFENKVKKFQQALTDYHDELILVTNQINETFTNSAPKSNKDFVDSFSAINLDLPGINNVSWVSKINDYERLSFEESLRERGLNPGDIFGFDNNGNRRVSPNKPYYLVINYSTSPRRSISDVGLDLLFNPFIGESVRASMRKDDVAASRYLRFVDGQNVEPGFLVYRAVNQRDNKTSGNNLLGLILIRIDLVPVFEHLYQQFSPKSIALSVTSIGRTEENFFRSPGSRSKAKYQLEESIDFFELKLVMRYLGTRTFENQISTQQPQITYSLLVVIFFISLGATVLLFRAKKSPHSEG